MQAPRVGDDVVLFGQTASPEVEEKCALVGRNSYPTYWEVEAFWSLLVILVTFDAKLLVILNAGNTL